MLNGDLLLAESILQVVVVSVGDGKEVKEGEEGKEGNCLCFSLFLFFGINFFLGPSLRDLQTSPHKLFSSQDPRKNEISTLCCIFLARPCKVRLDLKVLTPVMIHLRDKVQLQHEKRTITRDTTPHAYDPQPL